jgi:hypothetical protein
MAAATFPPPIAKAPFHKTHETFPFLLFSFSFSKPQDVSMAVKTALASIL